MSSQREPKKASAISRRQFIKTVAGTGAALSVSGFMSGCTTPETGTNVTNTGGGTAIPTAVVAAGDRPFAVHDTDVLIIGGGITGLFAARTAIANGASVLIVDKGLFGHSGSSGINWGHGAATTEYASDLSSTLPYDVIACDGLVDQDYQVSLEQCSHEAELIATAIKMGNITERTKTGEPIIYHDPSYPIGATMGIFPRMFAQHARRSGAQIFDRMMITDILLTDQGEAAGAVGVSMVSGDAHVFRSKATIMATGSYTWCHGWAGNGAITSASPENTGDGHSMFLKLGVEMRDMELMPLDTLQIYPKGIAFSMGGVGLEEPNRQYGLNKDGQRFDQVLDKLEIGAASAHMRLEMKELNEGRGTPGGGLLLDTTQIENFPRHYRHQKDWEMRSLQYQVPDTVEVHYHYYECCSRPAALGATGESPVKNLFYAGEGTSGISSSGIYCCSASGYMVGKNAAARAAETDHPNVVWSQVQEALNQAYSALESQPEGAIRSLEVYHNIQNAMSAGLAPLRNEKSIQGCIDELNRIKSEEFPKISVPSKSRRFNLDWRHALEIPNMWNCVMGTAQAALLRKETRGTHCRTDFPKMDNANWLVNTIVSVKDGAWSATTRPIVATVIPADQVAKMVPEIGID